MNNHEKITVHGAHCESAECCPLFIADGLGPLALRYVFVSKQDLAANYNSGSGVNVRRSSSNLASYWRTHNSLIINQCHLGNIVFRIKAVNIINNSVDMIEVWRSRDIVDRLFNSESDSIEIEQATVHNPEVRWARSDITQGGTGLVNGSGLTIDDPDSPRVWTRTDRNLLGLGLAELGFEIRTWIDRISHDQADEVYRELVARSAIKDSGITINTGWNLDLNPLPL
jgi:hypothetical protein